MLCFTIALVFKFNHLFYESPCMLGFLFLSTELSKNHHKLSLAPPGSVHRTLHRTYQVNIGTSKLQKLYEISKVCEGFQLFFKQANRHFAVLHKQCVFNLDVTVDIIFTRVQTILYVVCRKPHASCVAPPAKQNTEMIWETLKYIWIPPYLGVPYLWVDQAKFSLSIQLKTLVASLGCKFVPIAAETN